MSEYQVADLATLNKGAVGELFEGEFQKVLDNIQDINTDPKAVRTVTIEIKVKPNEERTTATTTVQVKSRLAPFKPHDHFVTFGPRNGKVAAFTVDPNEQDLPFGADGNIREFGGGGEQ